MRWSERRRLRQAVPEMSHWEAGHLMRSHLRAGSSDRATLLKLADRALETLPDPEPPGERAALQGYRNAIAAGRRIKFSTYPVTFLEPVPTELADAVEEALTQGDSS